MFLKKIFQTIFFILLLSRLGNRREQTKLDDFCSFYTVERNGGKSKVFAESMFFSPSANDVYHLCSDKLSPLPSDGDFRVTVAEWRTDVRELCALVACSRSEYSKPVANASRPLTPLSMNLCDSFGVEELVTAPVNNAPLDHSHFHPTCKL